MEEDKISAEASNSNNNRSHSGNNNVNSTSNSQRPSSSNSSPNKMSVHNDDSSIGEGGVDDIGWWDCSLCTYKNSADKFKCEICDLRRGTSTRKPRCNADNIVAQVVKQQEQIRQQTKAKPHKTRNSTSLGAPSATSSTDINANPRDKSRASELKTHRMRTNNSVNRDDADDNDDDSDDSDDSQIVNSPKRKRKRLNEAKSRKLTSFSYQEDDYSSTDVESNDDITDNLSHTSSQRIHRSASGSSLDTSHYSSSSSMSPEPTTSSPLPQTKSSENPFKVTPLEVNGNLIKYSPPTSSGRTGLIIDKKRFTQHSVTVNDVTITFTEFATRQNKYIRKKKKSRRDAPKANKNVSNNSVGKSRLSTKSEPRSTSNNSTSTAAGDD